MPVILLNMHVVQKQRCRMFLSQNRRREQGRKELRISFPGRAYFQVEVRDIKLG